VQRRHLKIMEKTPTKRSESKNDDKAGGSSTSTAADIGSLSQQTSFGNGTEETLAVGNPITDFLRNQKGNFKDMKEEDFLAKYNEYMKEQGLAPHQDSRSDSKGNASRPVTSQGELQAKPQSVFQNGEGSFRNIVLKFTTLSEGCFEAPSFTVDRKGAKIGRETSNSICVPSDQRLAPEAHASIEYTRGAFHIQDGGVSPFAASVRIGVGNGHGHGKKWYLEKASRFSAGNSVIESCGVNEHGELELIAVEGPLKDKQMVVAKTGATFGRSSDNHVCIPDKELSRKHTRIDYDEKAKRYVVSDMGSTNGTYVQLVGPYAGRYKLNLNDHILIGRTGFSINRYDYGLSEEMGYRQSMEDACTIVQHLNIGPLCIPDLSPQSFFGVFDGHGGVEASHYLAQHLHVNVAHALLDAAHVIFQIVDEVAPVSLYDKPDVALTKLDAAVIECLKTSFLQTDKDFIDNSTHPQHGSTGTTALVLGKRLYCANVGDSRTMLCRKFAPMCLSEDHKPTREDEAKRIRDAGGFVINNRVMGELAVSRAFGDVDFKKGLQSIIEEEGGLNNGSGKSGGTGDSARNSEDNGNTNAENSNWDQPLIVAEPDVQVTTITDDDQFLLLGCDGLFDVYSPLEVVNFVKEQMLEHGDAQKCCQRLTYDAIRKRNSRDNVSVILIILNKWY